MWDRISWTFELAFQHTFHFSETFVMWMHRTHENIKHSIYLRSRYALHYVINRQSEN